MSVLSVKGFAGLDRRKGISESVATAYDMRNMRITHGGSVEKRAVTKMHCALPANIQGIWCGSINGSEALLAAAGGILYSVDTTSGNATNVGTVGLGECLFFEFDSYVYCKTQGFYGKFDGSRLYAVDGYIPCVAISCSPNGEGTLYEEINLLTDKRRQLFSSDGNSLSYKLAEDGISAVISLKVDGVAYTDGFTADTAKGEVRLNTAIPAGLNNIEIVYSKSNERSRILNCRRAMLFGGNSDGRIFLYGNPDYPNYRFYSQLADGIPSAEYFPVNAFTVIGSSKINCMVQQYDKMLIFTKNEAFYSYCELVSDALGNLVSSFPVFSLNGSKGCLIETDGCVIDNRPITLCDDGLNIWESTSVVNEKNASCISGPIADLINNAAKGEQISICDLQSTRELFFIADGTAYIYNYGIGAWYIYDSFGGKYHKTFGEKLYFANGSGIYLYTEQSERNGNGYYKSNFITNGEAFGGSNAVLLEADVYICGKTALTFTVEKSNGESRTRVFDFPEGTDRYMRLSFRLAQRRALPFNITLYTEGGICVLHSVTIKTRKKERSKRFGLL